MPNSLTWGPDGWLYGLNGVFNFSHVKYPETNPNFKADHKGWPITCAMFRIHPRTREFQIFAEGTSNPWGIAFNDEGEAFISACVIDHLWHIVETGYYHRQGGPYPPFTWKIDSIVKHKHQKAAYCGIHYFDSDAYPEQYRGKLYMGNIHGGCINVDKLQRDGSTYFATGEPDFLTANDAWFMPVVQKTGPDGCLYILDWYDRYHCYQDANRDPAGIDRLKGRLYRVRYKDSPRTPKGLDLAKESDEQLIQRLKAKNDFFRWTATRLLQERTTAELHRAKPIKEGVRSKIHRIFSATDVPTTITQLRHATFVLAGTHHDEDPKEAPEDISFEFKQDLAAIRQRLFLDQSIDGWLMRIMADNRETREMIVNRARFPNWNENEPEKPGTLTLQSIIGTSKTRSNPRAVIENLISELAATKNDKLIPHIVWQNLHPRLEDYADDFLEILQRGRYLKAKPVADLMPRVVDRILGRQKFDAQPIGKLFALLRDDHPQVGRQVLEVISAKVQSGELKGEKLDQLKAALAEPLTPLLARSSGVPPDPHPLSNDAALLAVSWGDPRGLPQVRRSFATAGLQPDLRLKALYALIAAKDEGVLVTVGQVLDDKSQISNLKSENPNLKSEILNLKSQLLTALGRLDDPKVADVVLTRYANLDAELQPSAIELLTQRANWSKQLLSQVGEKKIVATAINVNQARRIQALKDAELSALLSRHWGQVRDTRNPDREKVVAEMKSLIRQKPGDPFAGEKVFKRVCAACHKIYGEGPDIGPDITSNGRNDFNQLLSNVFDPSLVIGAGYRVCTVVNKAGRVQSGLLVEDSPQRVVLKPAAVGNASRGADSPTGQPVTVTVGQLQIIPRDDIDEFKINELSLMPEGLEKQLALQEITDLFAFLVLDKHPKEKSAKRLPGVE